MLQGLSAMFIGEGAPLKPDFLNTSLSDYFSKICEDPIEGTRSEGLFLLAMAELEKMAGDQILSNRTSRTPTHLLEDIETHANDEYRHSRQLHKMGSEILSAAPLTSFERRKLRQMTEVAKSFVTGYFGNPSLAEATSRHAAYVHGALTIEQFPFQVYSMYLQKTKIDLVREQLPAIIADEHQHIQFGRQMRSELSEDQKLDLGKLHQIEKKMCGQLFSRLQRIHAADTSLNPFCRAVTENASHSVAWIQTLGHAEKRAADATERFFEGFQELRPEFMAEHLADETRHQKMLHRSILLQRRKYRADQNFQQLEAKMCDLMFHYQNRIFARVMRALKCPGLVYFYATSLIESRVFKHYLELIQASNDILVTYTLNEILSDEIEHASIFHHALKAHPDFSPELFKELKAFENRCFLNMNLMVLKLLPEPVADVLPACVDERRELAFA